MSLIRLFPEPARTQPLRGTYLDLALHRAGRETLLYANFISSLDGRIAVPNATGEMQVPNAIANPRDWRLYQELAAQCCVMITSARYFRQLAKGCAQALLPVEGELSQWRAQQGLPPQPEILILSRSMDIPIESLRPFADRAITVLTAEIDHGEAARARRLALENEGVTVVQGDRNPVGGQDVLRWMEQRGLRRGYAIAGCGVFHTLLRDGVLHRLFLTTRHALLGGSRFDTLLRDALPASIELRRRALYYDPVGAQDFADYDVVSQHQPTEERADHER